MVTAAEARKLSQEALRRKEEQVRPEAMKALEVLLSKIAKAASIGDNNIIYDKISYHVDSIVVANLRGLGYDVELVKNTYLIHW